ncbi:hypothetical protein [Rhodococcus koreensis]
MLGEIGIYLLVDDQRREALPDRLRGDVKETVDSVQGGTLEVGGGNHEVVPS